MQQSACRRSRTRSFTGCWTCRRRRVKCDEGKPFCYRCQKANKECEGYEVRLAWGRNTGLHSFRHSKHHRLTLKMSSPTANLSSAAIASKSPRSQYDGEALDRAETSAGNNTSPIGIRHMSVVDQGEHVSPCEAENSPQETPVHAIAESDVVTLVGTDPIGCSDSLIHDSSSLILQDLDDLDHSLLRESQLGASPDLRTHPPSPPRKSLLHTPCSLACPEQPSGLADDCDQNPEPSLHTASLPRNLEVLPDFRVQRQLLEHWATHLVDDVLPVATLNNPLRWLISPIALEGMRASSDTLSPSAAVFHLICSTSAYQLNRLTGQNRFLRLVLHHHRLGLQHLRHCITSTDKTHYVPLLAALSMCLIHETFTVGNTFWRVHIRGACEWIRRFGANVWFQSRESSTAYQIFLGLATMIQLQLGANDVLPIPEEHHLLIPFYDPREQYCIDEIYGLSRPTFDKLRSVIQIEAHRRSSPSSCLREQDLLEMELYLSMPQLTPPRADICAQELIYHQSSMFYYAFLIFVRRTWRGVPLAEVQTQVRAVFDHLQASLNCTGRSFSPAVWPIALASFETQEYALHRFVVNLLDLLIRRTQFDIWKYVQSLAQEIWEARKSGNGTAVNRPWEEYLEQTSCPRVLLV